eukprot:SAG11_NODE_613_length_8205_cov_28.925487_8_plen_78_part_00
MNLAKRTIMIVQLLRYCQPAAGVMQCDGEPWLVPSGTSFEIAPAGATKVLARRRDQVSPYKRASEHTLTRRVPGILC